MAKVAVYSGNSYCMEVIRGYINNAETKFVGTRVNFDWYEIIPGTGKDAGGNPATSDAVLAASLVIVAAAAAVVFTMKKR